MFAKNRTPLSNSNTYRKNHLTVNLLNIESKINANNILSRLRTSSTN